MICDCVIFGYYYMYFICIACVHDISQYCLSLKLPYLRIVVNKSSEMKCLGHGQTGIIGPLVLGPSKTTNLLVFCRAIGCDQH